MTHAFFTMPQQQAPRFAALRRVWAEGACVTAAESDNTGISYAGLKTGHLRAFR